jgi:hypothetical protein
LHAAIIIAAEFTPALSNTAIDPALRCLRLPLTLLLIALAGCAGLPASRVPTVNAGEAACRDWYERLDQAIDASGVRDAGETRLAGFPYLRTDRFSASFRDAAKNDIALRESLLTYMMDFDRHARHFEIANLPRATGFDTSRLDACTQLLSTADGNDATRGAAWLEQLEVPDDYSNAKRTLGAYAITSLPFFAGVTRWQEQTQARFQGEHVAENMRRYLPAEAAGVPLHLPNPSARLLGIPSLSPADWKQLLAYHAPVLDVQTQADFDRFGRLKLKDGEAAVDVTQPTAYQRIAFTRFKGATLVQLVYTFWFPERPVRAAFDLLSGKLDGVMIRVTLDENGDVLLVDSIHACGCYQLFFPTPALMPKPPPEPGIEWAFVPKRLRSIGANQRIAIRISSGTHYLEDIDVVPRGGSSGVPYLFADDDELRSLTSGEGKHRSLFGPDGIVAGSERGERVLFWPMGIASPGAMRQWGRHATAFVGRRHFDDADLIERRFQKVE